jgi:DNA-directed RNA polymerase specialized sigma24 family protein
MKTQMAAPPEPDCFVFRAAYRITGNPDDAEDVLQTVFLRMLKRDPARNPSATCPASSTARR